MQALQQLREGVPVVKHEVSHAQEGELLQPACTSTLPHSTLCYSIKGLLIIPLQSVLAGQGNARSNAGRDDLL